MLTVKQLADDIGVSKVAVNKKIENLGLKSALIKDGNRYLIGDDVADQVRHSFRRRQEQTTTNARKDEKTHSENGTESNKPGAYDDVVKALTDQLAVLTKQLEEKDRQIERLHTLMAQQNQLYLTDGRTGSTQEVDAVDAETVNQEETKDEQKEGKKSLWSRLFG